MKAPLFLGIDGGGTSLRVAIVDADLATLWSLTESSANPNVIGPDIAQIHIQGTIRALLQLAALPASAIAAAGIGIAGASQSHSRPWLLQTIKPVLPDSLLVPSSDLEIALVGALAKRHGILLLAGTGSAVFGIAPDGRHLQVGGWGYLLGDEGSSFWIGSRLLRQIIREYDSGTAPDPRSLTRLCLDELNLTEPRDLIAWLYRSAEAPPVRVAGLAKLVMNLAENGSQMAENLLQMAAIRLENQVKIMQRRLDYADAEIAFAGGLLDNANPLSLDVAQRLGLPERPVAKFAPVIGAALLAEMEWSAAQ